MRPEETANRNPDTPLKEKMTPREAVQMWTVMAGPALLLDLFVGVSVVKTVKSFFAREKKSKTDWLFRLGALFPVVYFAAIRPWLARYGATNEEARKPLVGDDFVPDPLVQYTRAITINAPIEKVWPWLVQIGQDRGGFYSYDWLEGLAALGIHNADRIHPEWQNLKVGDRVKIAKSVPLEVKLVEPGRAIILDGWGALILERIDVQTTRFIIRDRIKGKVGLAYAFLEIPNFVMERQMLKGLKRRAEGGGG